MTEAVEFPDVVAFYETWLQAALAANGYPEAKVSEKWSAQPGEFVWLQRDGGPRVDVVREVARLRVNVISDRQIRTFTARVRALIGASAGVGPIKRVGEITGPIDVSSLKPQRFMTYEVVVRGSALVIA